MSDYLLADRSESALASVLTEPVRTALGLSASASVPVYTGKNFTDKGAFSVVVECEVADEETQFTGNHFVTAAVTVKSPAHNQPGHTSTKTFNLAALSAVQNVLSDTTLEASLTAAETDFHVFEGSIQREGSSRSQDENSAAWVDTINLRFLACANDLS